MVVRARMAVFDRALEEASKDLGAGEWQGYDLWFTAPRWNGTEKIANARITAKTPNPSWYPPKSIREEHAAEGDPRLLKVTTRADLEQVAAWL